MGDKIPSKAEREVVRRRNMAARDEYDMNNLGDYKLVFPVRNDPVCLLSNGCRLRRDSSNSLWTNPKLYGRRSLVAPELRSKPSLQSSIRGMRRTSKT